MPPGLDVGRVILADQVKSLVWRQHRALIATAPTAVVDEVLAKLETLVGRRAGRG